MWLKKLQMHIYRNKQHICSTSSARLLQPIHVLLFLPLVFLLVWIVPSVSLLRRRSSYLSLLFKSDSNLSASLAVSLSATLFLCLLSSVVPVYIWGQPCVSPAFRGTCRSLCSVIIHWRKLVFYVVIYQNANVARLLSAYLTLFLPLCLNPTGKVLFVVLPNKRQNLCDSEQLFLNSL